MNSQFLFSPLVAETNTGSQADRNVQGSLAGLDLLQKYKDPWSTQLTITICYTDVPAVFSSVLVVATFSFPSSGFMVGNTSTSSGLLESGRLAMRPVPVPSQLGGSMAVQSFSSSNTASSPSAALACSSWSSFLPVSSLPPFKFFKS